MPVGADVIERLRPLTERRPASEFLLTRWVHRQIGAMEWARVERSSWTTAALMQRGWRKALALANMPYVQAYALRHSSIVRQLREGLPVRVVAGLHDTSTAMIERHYSAHILDMADELGLRRAITPLVGYGEKATARCSGGQLVAKRGRKPELLPPGVRRREKRRHEMRIWLDGAPDDPPTLVLKEKKTIRPVGRPKMSTDRAKALLGIAHRHGHLCRAWPNAKGFCVAGDEFAPLAQ